MTSKQTEVPQISKKTVQPYKDVKTGKFGENGAKVKPYYFIGIDTGVNTGFAVWSTEMRKFMYIDSLMVHQAMDLVKEYAFNHVVKVIVEDPRLRKWFGSADSRQAKSGAGIREGVGSVKRDANIWEDFLTDNKIPFEMAHPLKGATKMNAEAFKRVTKYEGRTNEHSRDAAMLVINRNY